MKVIYSYSRQNAIDDGVLVDISEMAKEAGFKYPTACTTAVYGLCENIPEKVNWQDANGRVWDVLTMALHGIRTTQPDEGNNIQFKVIIDNGGQQKYHDLKIHCGPGDKMEPVLTIMTQHED